MKDETKDTRLVNEPTGKPIILRSFKFNLPPDLVTIPTEEDLKDAHKRNIEAFLWKDDLLLIEELRIMIDKEKNIFYIFATCQPKRGANLWEKPTTLQDIFKKK
jgi:hypothetical protein